MRLTDQRTNGPNNEPTDTGTLWSLLSLDHDEQKRLLIVLYWKKVESLSPLHFPFFFFWYELNHLDTVGLSYTVIDVVRTNMANKTVFI